MVHIYGAQIDQTSSQHEEKAMCSLAASIYCQYYLNLHFHSKLCYTTNKGSNARYLLKMILDITLPPRNVPIFFIITSCSNYSWYLMKFAHEQQIPVAAK